MRYLGVAAAVVLAALLPWFAPNQFYIHLATIGCMNLMLVLGLAIIARAGQLSMGHGGFALIGGYVSALLSMKGLSPLLSLFIAGLVAAAIAAALGWIILRLRGVYFVLVAFAFSQIAVLLALDMSSVTGGANGLVGVPPISIFGHVLLTKPQFYPLALVCALATLLLTWLLYRSPLGTMMAATAENQRLTESSGVDTHRVQVIAFTIGSGIAGFAGALSTHYLRFISPDSYTFWESVSYLTMLVVGGRDGVLGPVVGVLVLTPLPELLRATEGLQHIIYGAMLVLCLMFVPNGLASLVLSWRSRQRSAKAGAAVVAKEVP
ncbi:branched-chain amino acid ABC transporter permease [Bradyrhizobium sp. F1.4.3]|uniref:branched-chain amino acid ABC transporter permease n=1 Tax=Bradyrhizobium sp. F1.4.3 TaxID=3156356 RepID=UPI003392FF4F